MYLKRLQFAFRFAPSKGFREQAHSLVGLSVRDLGAQLGDSVASDSLTYPCSCKLFNVVHFFQTSMFFLIVPSPLERDIHELKTLQVDGQLNKYGIFKLNFKTGFSTLQISIRKQSTSSQTTTNLLLLFRGHSNALNFLIILQFSIQGGNRFEKETFNTQRQQLPSIQGTAGTSHQPQRRRQRRSFGSATYRNLVNSKVAF